MIQILNPQDCCGCTACSSICPKDAITMEPDALGFLYPKVNTDKCVDCGLCDKVCQFNDNYDKSLNYEQPKAFAVRHKREEEIIRSRSGAAFVAISDYVLNRGGVVYGVGYKNHFRVAHKRATTKDERDEFRGSKYVQSDLRGIFKLVKKDLQDGIFVLFSGTPCQTSGLNAYVGKKLRKNLLLIDIVCHGVPGPYLWRDYLKYIEKVNHDIIEVVNFRDKNKYGWKAHIESFKFLGGGGNNQYTTLFYQHIMFRHSCGVCHFANLKRPSDITLADFWGWEKSVPGFNDDDKGCSLVLINTDLGATLFNEVSSELNVVPVDVTNCLQNNLRQPTAPHPQRDEFEQYYKRHGFESAMIKYVEGGQLSYYSKRTIRKVKNLIKRLIRR